MSPPEVVARDEYVMAAAAARLVAEAPPLTERQIARINAILKAAPREQVARK
jgi:hypothetical protein